MITGLLDLPVYQIMRGVGDRTSDWMRMFKALGYFPLWAAGAAALVMVDWPRRRLGIEHALHRGWLLLAGAAASGIAAELLKLLFRRGRPPRGAAGWDGSYHVRSFLEGTFDSGGLGLPSSHVCVAFGGLWMLCWMFPRAIPVWLIFGGGVVLTRLMDGGHFLSDAWVSVCVSAAITYAIWRWEMAKQARILRERIGGVD